MFSGPPFARLGQTKNSKPKTQNSKLKSSRADHVRPGIAPQYLHERAVFLQLPDGSLHQFVFAVAFNINEKEVFPVLTFRRSALDLAHAQFQPVKRLERGIQGADSILYAEHQRGIVITGLS